MFVQIHADLTYRSFPRTSSVMIPIFQDRESERHLLHYYIVHCVLLSYEILVETSSTRIVNVSRNVQLTVIVFAHICKVSGGPCTSGPRFHRCQNVDTVIWISSAHTKDGMVLTDHSL